MRKSQGQFTPFLLYAEKVPLYHKSTYNSTMPDDAVYFWKPEEENGYLGQWYPSRFTSTDEKEINYENTEQ